MKKYLAMMLAIVMVAGMLAGCGSSAPAASTSTTASAPAASSEAAAPAASATEAAASSGAQTPNLETGNTTKTDETLVVELSAVPDFIWHPGVRDASGSNESSIILFTLLDRLVEYDEVTGEVVPMLADSWEVNEDGNEFTFHIRQGVKMVDGEILTAADVVFTFETFMDRCSSGDSGRFWSSVELVDDETVKLTTFDQCPDMLKMLSYGNYGIFTEAQIEACGGYEEAYRKPVLGVGRYFLKEFKDGEYVLLERNEDYWDTNYAGYFKYIKCIGIAESSAKVAGVQAGDAQVAYDVPIALAKTYIDNPSLRTYVYPMGEPQFFWFNQREGHPTADIRVRQAISKCLNHAAITGIATAGLGTPNNSYVSPSCPYYVPGWTDEELAIDIEGAKALLADAGYDDSNPLEICVYALANDTEVWTVVQANLKAAGINLTINNVDMGGYVPAMLFEKSYDVCMVGQTNGIRLPSLNEMVSGGISFGGPGVAIEDQNEILVRLMKAADDEEAKAILAEYQEAVKANCTYAPMHDALKATIVSADLKGYSIHERAFIDLSTMYK
ncbi:MAG: ABC transporter substrate-binding protein [Oscillospiraceae bacterium]|nr:ABC transporter substrate-binding protein [Oscillospiraceae bacterium]